MANSSFVFYESFLAAASALDDASCAAVVRAICDYGIYGKEPDSDGVVKAMFLMAKPVIDKNNQRRENGRKGGEASATSKQTGSKAVATTQQDDSEDEAMVEDTTPISLYDEDEDVDEERDVEKDEEVSLTLRVCSEQNSEPLAVDLPAIPLNDGSEWVPSLSTFNEWVELYPAVDIKTEFGRMRQWCLENPKRKKTKKGVRRFARTWIDKQQNRGGGRAAPRRTMEDFIHEVDAW